MSTNQFHDLFVLICAAALIGVLISDRCDQVAPRFRRAALPFFIALAIASAIVAWQVK